MFYSFSILPEMCSTNKLALSCLQRRSAEWYEQADLNFMSTLGLLCCPGILLVENGIAERRRGFTFGCLRHKPFLFCAVWWGNGGWGPQLHLLAVCFSVCSARQKTQKHVRMHWKRPSLTPCLTFYALRLLLPSQTWLLLLKHENPPNVAAVSPFIWCLQFPLRLFPFLAFSTSTPFFHLHLLFNLTSSCLSLTAVWLIL